MGKFVALIVLAFSIGAHAQECVRVNGDWYDLEMRRESVRMVGGNVAYLLSEEEISPEAHQQLLTMINSSPSAYNDETRAHILAPLMNALGQRRQDLTLLRQYLSGDHPPSYIIVDLGDIPFNDAKAEANVVFFQTAARVQFGQMTAETADDLLLLTVGPAFYLRVKEPNLMAQTKFASFHREHLDVLLAGGAAPQAPDGNGVIFVGRHDLEGTEHVMLTLCHKAQPDGKNATLARVVPKPAHVTLTPASLTPTPASLTPTPTSAPASVAPEPASVAPVSAPVAPKSQAAVAVAIAKPPGPALRHRARASLARRAVREPVRESYAHSISREIVQSVGHGIYKHTIYEIIGGRRVAHWYIGRNR